MDNREDYSEVVKEFCNAVFRQIRFFEEMDEENKTDFYHIFVCEIQYMLAELYFAMKEEDVFNLADFGWYIGFLKDKEEVK